MNTYKKQLMEKIIQTIITASIAAGIAFLQSIITQASGAEVPVADPKIAGAIGGSLQALRNLMS